MKVTGAAATLDILVENGGRINYGGRLPDNRKGITESVTLGDRELTGWEMYKLPFDNVPTLKSSSHCRPPRRPSHRGTFELSQSATRFSICAAGAKASSSSTATISAAIGISARSRRFIVPASGSRRAAMRFVFLSN